MRRQFWSFVMRFPGAALLRPYWVTLDAVLADDFPRP
jgi:hypothetical protein